MAALDPGLDALRLSRDGIEPATPLVDRRSRQILVHHRLDRLQQRQDLRRARCRAWHSRSPTCRRHDRSRADRRHIAAATRTDSMSCACVATISAVSPRLLARLALAPTWSSWFSPSTKPTCAASTSAVLPSRSRLSTGTPLRSMNCSQARSRRLVTMCSALSPLSSRVSTIVPGFLSSSSCRLAAVAILDRLEEVVARWTRIARRAASPPSPARRPRSSRVATPHTARFIDHSPCHAGTSLASPRIAKHGWPRHERSYRSLSPRSR